MTVDALRTASDVIHFHSGYLEMRIGAWNTLYFMDIVVGVKFAALWNCRNLAETCRISCNRHHRFLLEIASRSLSGGMRLDEAKLVRPLWRNKIITHRALPYRATTCASELSAIPEVGGKIVLD
jgi:hypothetical protein